MISFEFTEIHINQKISFLNKTRRWHASKWFPVIGKELHEMETSRYFVILSKLFAAHWYELFIFLLLLLW